VNLFRPKSNHQYPLMRQPDKQPRCYDMTEFERLEIIHKSKNSNLGESAEFHCKESQSIYYGA